MKICYQCQIEKSDSEFYRDNRSEDLLTSSCKDCQKARAKKRYRENPLTEDEKKKKSHYFQEWKSKNYERYLELSERHNRKRSARGDNNSNVEPGLNL